MHRSAIRLSLAVFAVVLGSPAQAFAYLDPGSGNVLLQLLLGGIAGALTALRLYWHQFMGLFRRKNRPATTPPATDHDR